MVNLIVTEYLWRLMPPCSGWYINVMSSRSGMHSLIVWLIINTPKWGVFEIMKVPHYFLKSVATAVCIMAVRNVNGLMTRLWIWPHFGASVKLLIRLCLNLIYHQSDIELPRWVTSCSSQHSQQAFLQTALLHPHTSPFSRSANHAVGGGTWYDEHHCTEIFHVYS